MTKTTALGIVEIAGDAFLQWPDLLLTPADQLSCLLNTAPGQETFYGHLTVGGMHRQVIKEFILEKVSRLSTESYRKEGNTVCNINSSGQVKF